MNPRWARGLGAAGGAAAILGLVGGLRRVTHAEAWLTGRLFRAVGVAESHSVGGAVVYPLDGRWVGFTITPGCSAALLLVAPLGMAVVAGVCARVPWPHAVASVVVSAVLLLIVNEARLACVVAAMRWWGLEKGYERSHVLLGSAISVLGLIGAVIAFAFVLSAGRPRRAAHGT